MEKKGEGTIETSKKGEGRAQKKRLKALAKTKGGLV